MTENGSKTDSILDKKRAAFKKDCSSIINIKI